MTVMPIMSCEAGYHVTRPSFITFFLPQLLSEYSCHKANTAVLYGVFLPQTESKHWVWAKTL